MPSNISVNVIFERFQPPTQHEEQPGEPELTPVYVRAITEWKNSCISSGFIGTGDLAWSEPEEDKQSCCFTTEFEPDISNPEALKFFGLNSNIIFIFYREESVDESTTVCVPMGMGSLDCSSFLTRSGSVTCKSTCIDGVIIRASAAVDEPLIPMEQLIMLEPLIISINSLDALPQLEGERPEDAVKSTYLFGELDFGGEILRPVFAIPSMADNDLNNTMDSEATLLGSIKRCKVDLNVCVLPGLFHLEKFKDCLTSSTFVFELHSDNLIDRILDKHALQEYRSLLELDAAGGGGGRPASGKGKAASKPPAKAPPKGAVAVPTPKFMLDKELKPSDRMFLDRLWAALRKSRQLRSHGTARCRLEQLLSSSNDLLKKFSKKRDPSNEEEEVVVKEEMLLEVRMERPSKPEKWDLPVDISLRSALRRAKEAGSTESPGKCTQQMGVTGSTVGERKRRSKEDDREFTDCFSEKLPRHERFRLCGTNIQVTAEIRRQLLPDPEIAYYSETMNKTSILKEQLQQTRRLDATLDADALSSLNYSELEQRLNVTPFTRMIILCKFIDDDTLLAVNEAVNFVNKRALPDIQGTIRSYSFTEEERQQAIDGSLDVISGFMILDDDWRLFVLEGLAAPGKGMEVLFTDYLPRVKANDEHLKILCNPQVLFPKRIYPDFSPDIRRIRVRDKLKKLARKPEVYNRKQVEEICFEAVDKLMALRRADNLLDTKRLENYPSGESLSKLELLYGEAITRLDMDGSNQKLFLKAYDEQQDANKRRKSIAQHTPRAELGTAESSQDSADEDALYERKRPAFEATDCRNPEFEQFLRSRPQHRVDILKETKELRRQAWLGMLSRREGREMLQTQTLKRVLQDEIKFNEKEAEPPKLFMYSTQSQNYKTKAFSELRSRVAADRHATYTFSQNFVSQTVCVVDEEEEKKKARANAKQHWLTPSGFVYPKPKKRHELLQHPSKPSEARIEDLKEPFRDATDLAKVRSGGPDDDQSMLSQLEKGFVTQLKAEKLFGALEPPQFEREFQLKLVGDKQKLPRGTLVNPAEKNPNAFRSVFLTGAGQNKILAEAKKQEEDAFQAKVVVDHLDFKVGGYKIRDTPIPVDRTTDILHGEPKRLALKQLREKKNHHGRHIGYETTPLSIMNGDPFVSNAATNVLLRKEQPQKFVTAQLILDGDLRPEDKSPRVEQAEQTKPPVNLSLRQQQQLEAKRRREEASAEKPPDFMRYLRVDKDDKLRAMVAKRSHPPQDKTSAECAGPKWQPASSA